jgi:hypothetical protein
LVTTSERCSARSEHAGESLAGTASTIRRWLLIEHPGPWGRDGLLDARLSPGLGQKLRLLERSTASRVLLIRRPGRASAGTLTCYAVDTARPWTGRSRLSSVDEAAELDPSSRHVFEDVEGPLVVVCTHGRRDPCCAERGRPLARATSVVFPDVTWECTHVGGDRFAGNLVVFPHGLYFGRVEPERGPEVVRAYTEGRMVLDLYRGRSSHPTHVQAAEIALRTSLGLDGLDLVALEGATREDDHAIVTFAAPDGRYAVTLERTIGEPMRLTCHSEREESPTPWHPLEIRPVADLA